MKSALIILVTISLLSADAVRRPAFSEDELFDDLAQELSIASIAPVGLCYAITKVNIYLLNQEEGSAGLGFLGVFIGGLTALLGSTIIYSDIYGDSESVVSGWSLAGLSVGVVGTISVVYGVKSIRDSYRRSKATGLEARVISPVVFKVDGQYNIGAQLTILF